MKIVRCTHCGQDYDRDNVIVVDRYSDATVFWTPCCHRQVDDRQWRSTPDFVEVNGSLEPPQDECIFNRRQPDGTFRPLNEFFSREDKP